MDPAAPIAVVRAAWLLLVLALSGCLAAPPPATPTAATTSPAQEASPCAEGRGAAFLSTVSGGGFVPQSHVPRLVEVTHEGRIRVVQSHTQEGTGRVVEDPPGAMRGLNESTVRAMLARHNLSLEGRDLVVTQGVEAPLARADFDALCAHVVAAFPTLKADYPDDQGCADQGSTTWLISARPGEKTVHVDQCASAPGPFRALEKELDGLVRAAA